MKIFVIDGQEVIVCNMLFCNTDRETMRQGIKDKFHAEWVWWEDEIGTILDPVRGPNPKFGPGADALRD